MYLFCRHHKSEKGDKELRRLDTPLAAMLPSKYANVDVTELFPDFRPDKVSGCSCFWCEQEIETDIGNW